VPSTTAETLARPGLSFGKSTEESTQSAAFVPGAMRNSAPATERPSSPGEPPPTLATEGPPPTVTGEGSHEELDTHDLEDMDDANGAVDQALESTHAGVKEDDIVIADDLAEEVGDEPTDIKTLLDEEEEHTDAGVPPFRSGH